jgi:uncharacterized membrane protein
MDFLAHIFVCGCLFLLIDAIWLGMIAKDFYDDYLGRMLADARRLAPAFAVYVLYIWALLYFALEPALRHHSWDYLLRHALFFSLAVYGTYNLTNMATLRRWPFRIVLADIAWGVFASVAVVSAGYVIFP